MHNRDIVVIGSSMGGIEALSSLVGQLPADLPAAVLVVQHTSAESPGLLGEILDQRGALPAILAQDGMPIECGRIYVAPPNRHMLATVDGIRITIGPRENRSRPAIDPLFRTAAVNFRSRVIGVVLTGLLGDGAAGLLAIERCGGIAMVQNPLDAEYGDMPRRALDVVENAEKFALDELGAALVRHCSQPAPEPPPVPEALRIETSLTERNMGTDDWGKVPSKKTSFTCPECKGAMHEMVEEGLTRYRCRVGHAYSAPDLLGDKTREVEDSLWTALQTLEERAQMLESMATDDRLRGWTGGAGSYADRARETRMHADRIRALLLEIPS